jgi:hypothetical protein
MASLWDDGVFPATAERLHPVSLPHTGGRPIEGSPMRPVLEQAGVLDAQLLRLQRYDAPRKNGELVIDELAITFERLSGRILEIGSEREPSGPEFSENFDEGALGRWLNAQL